MKNGRMAASTTLAFLVAFVFSFFSGFVGEARASGFSGSFSVGGFQVNYGSTTFADLEDERVSVSMSVSSSVHRLDSTSINFFTLTHDPSEAMGVMEISGRKNGPINADHFSFASSFYSGGVSLYQGHGLRIDGFDPSLGIAYTHMQIGPFSVNGGSLSYYEYEVSPPIPGPGIAWSEERSGTPGEIRFIFSLYFWGSFGEGPEGDRRGALFVPPPGPATLAFVGVLAMFRRRR